jgi:hypothetical protein
MKKRIEMNNPIPTNTAVLRRLVVVVCRVRIAFVIASSSSSAQPATILTKQQTTPPSSTRVANDGVAHPREENGSCPSNIYPKKQ